MLQNPFKSFWMAGYECTDQLNAFGNRVDFLEVTGHLQLIDEDYRSLHQFNIGTVREGIRWSKVETRPYQYDWSTVKSMIEHGKANHIQQVWDICHFGFPDDLTPLHPMFARRFAAVCRAFVEFYRELQPTGPLVITPINEVSFLSWLGGDARGTAPYCINLGWEVKYSLMRAYIEGVAAIKEADPTALILTTEPMVNVVPPVDPSEEDIELAARFHEYQFQSVDMLLGRICPELGGRPENIDMLGFNFYYDNQYTPMRTEYLSWSNENNDPRWVPLHELMRIAYERYNVPMVLSETSHPGEHRPQWIEFIADQCASILEQKVPLYGVCLYPIIDRPDWDHLSPWHNAGLWDAEEHGGNPPKRILYEPYATALELAQTRIHELLTSGHTHRTRKAFSNTGKQAAMA
ncbi:amine oxidase [Segetibacter sp. 3557_3]|uniref:amine oxidase n=1 Tax=Segetibacter sp. 3557_3 TaxID=2547429 RepID=UPI0010586F86|nr:amine oxidase [Segetibacter sp. 3557_3]TDH27950.1 amine oxidase [Segetibacter sp. 3557_3]